MAAQGCALGLTVPLPLLGRADEVIEWAPRVRGRPRQRSDMAARVRHAANRADIASWNVDIGCECFPIRLVAGTELTLRKRAVPTNTANLASLSAPTTTRRRCCGSDGTRQLGRASQLCL
jgi:hypothetical protein